MFAYVLAVGVVLAGQLSAAEDRYSGGQSGGSATAPAAGSAANGSNGLLQALGDPPAQLDVVPGSSGASDIGSSAASGSNPPAATSGGRNPFRSTPSSNANPPRALSRIDANAAPVTSGQSQAAPAAYEVSPPPAAAAPLGGEVKPSAMMRKMLTPPNSSQLRGQSIPLSEALAGARTRAEQAQRIDAYWDLCSSVADYYLGLAEQQELRKLATSLPSTGVNWQRIESDFNTRIGTSQRAALVSQMRLASLMGRSVGPLPLPSDAPHCASYLTHFEQVFPGNAPAEARELAALLPSRFAELKSAGEGVILVEQSIQGTARNDRDGSATLQALQLLALQRRAFVQIARDYNRRIARYTELAAPGEINAQRLTGMLINSTASATARRPETLAPPTSRQSSNNGAPPPTFAAGTATGAVSATVNRDEAVRPASGSEEQTVNAFSDSANERSLVVPKR